MLSMQWTTSEECMPAVGWYIEVSLLWEDGTFG